MLHKVKSDKQKIKEFYNEKFNKLSIISNFIEVDNFINLTPST